MEKDSAKELDLTSLGAQRWREIARRTGCQIIGRTEMERNSEQNWVSHLWEDRDGER
jgi:hypothetical protein